MVILPIVVVRIAVFWTASCSFFWIVVASEILSQSDTSNHARVILQGTWWYRSIKFSAEQILMDTTQLYFYFFHKTPNMILKSERDLDFIEPDVCLPFTS